MLVLLVVGDPSADGHGRTETFRFDHNLISNSALKSAYKAGCKIIGHDIEDVVAKDYQDSSVPVEVMDALVEHGLMVKEEGNDFSDSYWNLSPEGLMPADSAYTYNDNININSELYAELWMRIAQLGSPALSYTVPKRSYDDKIDIGGYGFFE